MAKKNSFEDNIAQLEKVVSQLEERQLDLQQAIDLYERGVVLSKACREQLEQGERKLSILMAREDGAMEERELEEQNDG